jgi:hypothetical protein
MYSIVNRIGEMNYYLTNKTIIILNFRIFPNLT